MGRCYATVRVTSRRDNTTRVHLQQGSRFLSRVHIDCVATGSFSLSQLLVSSITAMRLRALILANMLGCATPNSCRDVLHREWERISIHLKSCFGHRLLFGYTRISMTCCMLILKHQRFQWEPPELTKWLNNNCLAIWHASRLLKLASQLL